jgi:hypothetical protein
MAIRPPSASAATVVFFMCGLPMEYAVLSIR